MPYPCKLGLTQECDGCGECEERAARLERASRMREEVSWEDREGDENEVTP